MFCTRCNGTGFLNSGFVPDELWEQGCVAVQKWMKEQPETDVAICDCCGDGEGWYGEPGEHYGTSDPRGHKGPYAYNGGLCECH